MSFENVRDRRLQWIWEESESFQRLRGESWMPEPCRSCDHRAEDFGGCRCQAFLLTGNAEATDPACSLAPAHSIVEAAVREANSGAAASSQPVSSSLPSQFNQQATALWEYRLNPE